MLLFNGGGNIEQSKGIAREYPSFDKETALAIY